MLWGRQAQAKAHLITSDHHVVIRSPHPHSDPGHRGPGTRRQGTAGLLPEHVDDDFSPSWDLVAELYTGPHANVDFTYASGTSSSLGVAVSVSGSFGTYSQSGKTTVGSTGSVDFARSRSTRGACKKRNGEQESGT